MREIGDGWTYAELLPRSRELDLGTARARVLDLDAVIESKRFANREKDRAALPVLLETLRLQKLKGWPGNTWRPCPEHLGSSR